MNTLVLGGARSGKSAVAEGMAATLDAEVTYLATSVVDPSDVEFAERVDRHRRRRPATWTTVEAGRDLSYHLATVAGVVLVDSLGSWVSAHDDLDVDVEDLVDALVGRGSRTVVVSEEVGLGVHPATDVGRHFRDVLGTVNQRVADVCDHVVLVVAGRVLPLERSRW